MRTSPWVTAARADEAGDLQVVGSDRALASAELIDPGDVQRIRADVVDPGAQGVEKETQLLDVRFGGGIADDRLSSRQHPGQNGVLSSGHTGFIEQHSIAMQPRRRRQPEQPFAVVGLDTVSGEAEQVRVDAPASNEVPTGRGKLRHTEAAKQRTRQQDGGTDLTAQVRIEGRRADLGRLDAQRVLIDRLQGDSQAFEQRPHRSCVANVGDVVQGDRLVRQKAGGQDRKGGVLVAGRDDLAAQRPSTFDAKSGHPQLRPGRRPPGVGPRPFGMLREGERPSYVRRTSWPVCSGSMAAAEPRFTPISSKPSLPM